DSESGLDIIGAINAIILSLSGYFQWVKLMVVLVAAMLCIPTFAVWCHLFATSRERSESFRFYWAISAVQLFGAFTSDLPHLFLDFTVRCLDDHRMSAPDPVCLVYRNVFDIQFDNEISSGK